MKKTNSTEILADLIRITQTFLHLIHVFKCHKMQNKIDTCMRRCICARVNTHLHNSCTQSLVNLFWLKADKSVPFSKVTRHSLTFSSKHQVLMCVILASEPGVCSCVCDLWWSERLFVLSSVKASVSRRVQTYVSHYK